MKISAPILTLLAGGALAGGLVVANSLTAGGTTGLAGVQVAGAGSGAATDDGAKAAAEEKAQAAQAQPSKAGSKKPAAGEAAGGGAATPGEGTAADAKAKVRRTYAGRIDGKESPLLAISVRDGDAIAYLCDGRLEAWFKGTAENGRLALTGKKGGTLTGTFDARGAAGTIKLRDGRTWDFDTPTAKKPSGLYRATAEVRGARIEGGWVVLADGRQVGLVTRHNAPAVAPRVDPATGRVTIDGQVLTAVAADPETGAGF
jgi:serine/threonine-protein kinase